MHKTAWIISLLGLYSIAANAESPDINDSIYNLTLEELMQVKTISIATGTEKVLHKAPAVATVITADEIANLGANSLYDILEQMIGLHIYPSPVNRMNPSFSIRGIHTTNNPQTLLLVNGVKISYEFSGARWDQFQIGVQNIDRIEVIRGPGSAIYGSDAYSGVINIITKGVDSEVAQSVGVKTGSFGAKSIWGNYAQGEGQLQYSVSGQYYKTDGDDGRIVHRDRMHTMGAAAIALSNAPGPLDTRRETFDIRSEVKYGGFKGRLWYLKNNSGTGPGIGNALSTGDWEKFQGITIASEYHWDETNDWTSHLDFSYQNMTRETYFIIFPAGFSIPRAFDAQGAPFAFTVFTEGLIGSPYANDEYFNGSLVAQYAGLNKHNLRFELGYRKSKENPEEYKNFGEGVLNGSEDFVDGTLTDVTNTPYIYLADQHRELGFLSIQDEWDIAAEWEFVIGARYDRYSDFGSTFNPRMALVWDVNPVWTTKFLYGRAFRAPSMQELYVTNNPLVQGNANLKPETIDFYEVVFDYHNPVDWQVTANVYSYKAKALIDSSLDEAGEGQFDNVGKQDGYGVELEAKWQPRDTFNGKFGYTWQHSEPNSSGQVVPEAPKQVVNLSFNWQIDDSLGVHMDSHWIIDRKRAFGDTRAQIDNYNLTNLTLSYQLTGNLMSKLTIRNLFDSDARAPATVQLPEDFPKEGRGIWFSMDYQF